MIIKAHAKINLVLDVLGRRTDGYHELAGIMHSIGLYDEISVMPADHCINVTCTEPIPKDNTAFIAATLFMDAAHIAHGVDIHIEKHIPSQAGLGGASADAAGVLTALQNMYKSLSTDELYRIGKAVGADVPFCLHGGCAYVTGIGDGIEPLPAQDLHILLVRGDRGISTKELFCRHDSVCGDKAPDGKLAIARAACERHDVDMLFSSCFNTLENAAFDFLPELAETKRRLIHDTDARIALMTGSGSVIYGLYDSEEAAVRAEKIMKQYGYSFVQAVSSAQ